MNMDLLCRILFSSTFIVLSSLSSIRGQGIHPAEAARAIHSAVNTENEWRPVGRLDPLRNEPTFDYSPPVLNRVKYWADQSSSNVPDAVKEKKEILLLGVPSKHTMKMQHPNQVTQIESKSINRRTFMAPPPSRYMTPPPMSQYQTDYGNAWTRDSLYPNDAFVDESAAHFTILRPKSSLNPYLTTSPSVYKDYRNSIYSLAANVNSLEATDSKKPWLQNLLHKEISYPSSPSTVTQVVMSHAPTIFESHSTQSVDNLHQSHPLHQQQQQPLLSSSSSSPFTLATTASQITFPIPTTTPTITLTTDELFSHYKQPVVETRPVPMFLIIQGHSKVKTYGGKDSVGNSETTKHLPKIRPVTMNKDPVINHVVSSDFHPSESHIVVNATTTHKPKPLKSIKVQSNSNTNSTMDSLLSFLDSSLGIFMAPDEIKSTKMPSKKVKATTAERTKSMKSTETEATPSSTTSVAYSVINSTVATTTTASN